jgi:hypothetical protein
MHFDLLAQTLTNQLEARVNDEQSVKIIFEYHRLGITNHKIISKLLLAEHGIIMR